METKGSWKIQNLRGVFKTFKSAESEEAKEWMRNRDETATPPKEKKVKEQKAD
jgi:hypothetical protein